MPNALVNICHGYVPSVTRFFAMGEAMHDVGGPLSGIEFHFIRRLR